MSTTCAYMYGNFTDEWLGQLINQVIPQKNRKALALAKSKLQPAKVQTSSASISVTFVPPTSHSSSNSFDLFGGALSVGGGLKTVSLLSDNQFNFANSGQTGESVPKTNLNFFSAPAPSVQALVPETSRTKHRKSEHPQKSKNADTIFPQTSNVSGLNFSAADFRGAESVCRNAAASSTAFQAFISLCVRADLAAISLIWNDLTSNHTSCIQKLCKPAQACNAWFCACGRHTRVDRAFQPLLGACVVLSTTAEDKSQATDSVRNNDIPSLRDDVMYFLPLSPCRSDLQTAVDASQTYVLPMVCEVSISDRWEAFMKLLSNAHMQKAIFHSQLALLPIIHGCEVYCPQRGAGAADIQYLVDPKVAAFLCSTAEFCDEQMMELPALLQEHHIPLPEDSPDDDGSKSPMGRVARMLKATQVELRAVLALQQSLSTQLSKLSMLRNYVRVEMPLVRLLALMEYYGVRMDIDELTQLQDTIEREITNVTQAAYAAAGEEFNLASPDQVAHVRIAFVCLSAQL